MAFAPDTVQGASFVITGLATFLDTTTDLPSVASPLPVVKTTHLGTTGQETMMAGDLEAPAQFTVTHQHDGSSVLPVKGTVYTVTITMPIVSGDSVGEKWAGTAICQDTPSVAANSDSSALQMQTTVWQPDGGHGSGSAWTHTVAS